MYDLIIIGAGPAGITAGIYATRYQLKTLIVGKLLGGVASEAFKVENYPGFKDISGTSLMNKFSEQLKYLGAHLEQKDVEKIEKVKQEFKILTGDEEYKAQAIIIATGTKVRKLNIPGEAEFTGKGVSYCATCDATFFKDKIVAIVGGGDAGATASLQLSDVAKKVYWIYREQKPAAMPSWQEQVRKNLKVEEINKTNVKKIKGNASVEKIILDRDYNGKKELMVQGLFVQIGAVPSADLAKTLEVKLNKHGYIQVDETQKTNIDGAYAAGDVTSASNRFKQIITACSEGAIAAHSVYEYVKR